MCVLLAGCDLESTPPNRDAPAASASQQLTTTALVRPVITASWQTLLAPMATGTGPYMNDHTVFKAANNNWYVYGISGGGPGAEKSFANGSSSALLGPYTEHAPIAHYYQGTTELDAWAPHAVVDASGVTHLFYRSSYNGNSLAVITTTDEVTWSAPTYVSISGYTWTGGDRDPMVMLSGSTYYLYFTSNSQTIGCATSTDLVHWLYQGPALTQSGPQLSTYEDAESPFVVKRGDYYYLFTTVTNSAPSGADYHQTLVFRSTDPLDFGDYHGDQNHPGGANFVTQLPVHAAEVVLEPTTNKWYITTAGEQYFSLYPQAQHGVAIAELQWQTASNDPAEPHNIPTSGLLTWLKFDTDGPNPAVDSSGHGNDGTSYGGTLPVSAGHNGGLYFSRTHDGVVYLVPQSLSGDFSVGAWINMSETPSSWDAIVSGSSQEIDFYDQYARLRSGNGYVVSSISKIQPNTWTHILVTRSSGTVFMYVNGSLEDSKPWSGVFTPAVAGETIFGNYLNGTLDDLVVYDHALSSLEISQLIGATNLAPSAAVTMSPNTSYEFEGWGIGMVNDRRRESIYNLSEGITTQAYTTANNTVALQFQLPSVKPISKVVLYPRNDYPWAGLGFPQDFTIDVWDAPSGTWVTEANVVGHPVPGNAGEEYTWTAASSQWVRIRATKLGLVSGYGYYMQLAEVEIY